MRNVNVGLVLGMLLVGCTQESEQTAQRESAVKKPKFDQVVLQQGRDLYTEHCAQCHGEQAQGADNWTQRRPDGKFPPPPLNGTGHTWHHSEAALINTIKHGTKRIGGSMPAWKDKLDEDQIKAILAWVQSQWPQELYTAWSRMNQQAIEKASQQQ
jgi:mono/diheme cytochrome c family protein